jgi:hypothetical protein
MIGLLWFDDDPHRDLRQKVGSAARRYTEKFGRQPTLCYVHPSMLDGLADNGASAISLDIGDLHLRVVPRRSVLRHHFWLGNEDDLST